MSNHITTKWYRVCGWCNTYLGWIEAASPPNHDPSQSLLLTHSICAPCAAGFKAAGLDDD